MSFSRLNQYWALLALFSFPVSAADRVFSGSLERVRHASISIRMDGGLVVDAVLPNGFAVPYNVADHVEMVCAPAKTGYDAAAGMHYNLQVKSLRLVRPASAEERARELELLSWQRGENLLRLPDAAIPAESPAELERVRKVNLDYADHLPNFVADVVEKRYRSEDAGKPWRLEHTIENEIAVKDSQLNPQNLRRDGKPWHPSHPFITSDFGLHLTMVFDPDCHTKVEFAGREESGGKTILAYFFTSPAGGCFWQFNLNGEKYTPGVSGRILAEAAKGSIIRCAWESSGFPEKFGFDWYTVTESWDNVGIGTSSYLVPVSTELTVRASDGSMQRWTVEYRNHRHFEASTNVTFH